MAKFPIHIAWLLFAAAAAVAIKLTAAYSLLPLGSALMAVFLAVSVWRPWWGLTALFPLIFALPPTPDGLGPNEIIYALICIVILIRALAHEGRNNLLGHHWPQAGIALGAVALLIIVNLVTAMDKGVLPGEWLRGLLPFCFIILFWPIGVFLRENPARIAEFGGSLFMLALLFSLQVITGFMVEGLYNPFWYVCRDGNLIQVAQGIAVDTVVYGPYYGRITTYIQQSTDALLPLGVVAGFTASLFFSSPRLRAAALALAAVSLTATLMTYTRSMLISIGISMALLTLILIFSQRTKLLKLISSYCFIILITFGSIFAFNMTDVWANRTLILTYTAAAKMADALEDVSPVLAAPLEEFIASAPATSSSNPPCLVSEPMPVTSEEASPAQGDENPVSTSYFKNDQNVTTRLREYELALEKFYTDPLKGAGLGTKHAISFSTSFGHVITDKVAYVHNWLVYMLMVGGLPFAISYFVLLAAPPIIYYRSIRKRPSEADTHNERIIFHLLWTLLLTISVYGLFFAVFRLITFNLLIAAAWGVAYAALLLKSETSK